jgi:glycosyltransferase involved in cell wall biosynthesis
MIKVLYATSNLGPGGKERQFYETITNLDHLKISPIVVVFKTDTFYSDRLKKLNIPFYQLSRGRLKIKPFFRIWQIIRMNKPDIVHSWDTLSMIYTYLPAKFFGLKIIDGSIRDSGVDRGIWYYYKKFFLNRANAVISNSQAGLKAHNINGYVIYNGINPERFHQEVCKDEFNIIMTANFSKYKDHFTFLKAAIFLLKKDSIDHVFLLGEGPKKEKYKSWIENDYPEIKEKIHFLGIAKDVEKYLAMCRVGVLCSTTRYGEGISNSVLEYMAAGLIPIVTDIGGSSEIIENEINGFLVTPGNENEIITLVQGIKNNNSLQERLVKNAGTTIKEKFSVEKNLELLTSFYTSLIN